MISQPTIIFTAWRGLALNMTIHDLREMELSLTFIVRRQLSHVSRIRLELLSNSDL